MFIAHTLGAATVFNPTAANVVDPPLHIHIVWYTLHSGSFISGGLLAATCVPYHGTTYAVW